MLPTTLRGRIVYGVVIIYTLLVTAFAGFLIMVPPTISNPYLPMVIERMRGIAMAVQEYRLFEDRNPQALEALVSSRKPNGHLYYDPTGCEMNASNELCDLWCNPYRMEWYDINSGRLISAGPNGRFGDSDDIVYPL